MLLDFLLLRGNKDYKPTIIYTLSTLFTSFYKINRCYKSLQHIYKKQEVHTHDEVWQADSIETLRQLWHCKDKYTVKN